MKISTKYLPIIGIAAIVLLLSVYYIHTSSVKYSLKKAYESIGERDTETFIEYFNVEAVVEDLHSQVLNHVDKNTETEDGLEEFGKNIGLGLGFLLKDKMVEEFKTELIKTIEAGEINTGNSYFSNVVSLDNFKKIKKVETKGKISDATLEFYSKKYEGTFYLNLRLRKNGRKWEIIRVPNAMKLVREAMKKEKTLLKKINAPIIEAMNEALKVTNVEKGVDSDLFGFERTLYLNIYMSGNPKYDKIKKFNIDIIFYEPEFDSEFKRVNVSGKFDDELDDQISYKVIMKKELNLFSDADDYMYNNSKKVKVGYEIKSIEFFNGDELSPYTYIK
jgi:hypothetical protein